MREKLFGRKSQTLDFYYPEKVELGIAIQILTNDIMHAVSYELSEIDTAYKLTHNITIELSWKSDNLGGSFTYHWLEAQAFAESNEVLINS